MTTNEITPCPSPLLHGLANSLIARLVGATANCDPPTDIRLRLEAIILERDELRLLIEAYRAKRAVDGGGGLEAGQGRVTPSRKWDAGKHYDADLTIEKLESQMAGARGDLFTERE